MAQASDEMKRRYQGTEHPREDESPEEIRARIARTRAEMTETVDTIQRRLSPERLRYEARETVREAAEEKVELMKYKARRRARTITDTIRDNPVPAALVGLGLGWLMMSGPDDDYDYDEYRAYEYDPEYDARYYARRSRAYPRSVPPRQPYSPYYGDDEVYEARYDDDGNPLEQAREKVGDAVHSVQEKASELTDSARQRTGQAAAQAQNRARAMGYRSRYRARRAKRGLQQTMYENPLAMGAVALAVGAAIGLSAPSTEYEDEMMGEYRDRIVDRAEEKARETAEKARHVAEETQQTAKESLKQTTEEVKETARQEAQNQNLTSESSQV